jgi:hypothetical protein
MHSWIRTLFTFGLAAIIGILPVACGSGKNVGAGGEEAKVPCEAYLFDTKVVRQGKQNSMRLEIYQTDTVMGLNGRAYLGKGALRGKLTPDTLAVFLPHSTEYLYEAIGDVLSATDCKLDSLSLDITRFFRVLPDSMKLDRRIKLSVDRHDANYPSYTIYVENCPWQMELVYDRQDTGWRILKFGFTNGKDLTLAATRREYRASATVKPERLQFSYPPKAERITL